MKNAFTDLGLRYLAARCLRDYSLPPNHTNLGTKTISDAIKSDWWNELQKITDAREHVKIRDSLRWVTLGLHHDWDSKVYSEELKNDFPPDLDHLICAIADGLGFQNYKPEAAIVNFYPINSSLAGHTDHSEYCTEPLFSISLGQAAIFLIGGKTKVEPANAIRLNHGDVAVMSGESRLCYHAVPKILQSETILCNDLKTVPSSVPNGFDMELIKNVQDENFWKQFRDYQSHCRININIRQVFKNKKMS